MKECQYKHKIELLLRATIEKEYDIVKKYLTLRTISRNDKGVDIIAEGIVGSFV